MTSINFSLYKFLQSSLAFLLVVVAAAIATPRSAHAQTLCDDPKGQCGKLVTQNCFSKLGAGSVPTSESENRQCGAQLEVYRSCLELVAVNCDGSGSSSRRSSDLMDAQEQKGINVALKRCEKSGNSATCTFTVELAKGSQKIYFYATNYTNDKLDTVLFTESGARVISEYFIVDGTRRKYSNGRDTPAGIPFDLSFEFDHPTIKSTSVSPLVGFSIKGGKDKVIRRFEFRDIKINQ